MKKLALFAALITACAANEPTSSSGTVGEPDPSTEDTAPAEDEASEQPEVEAPEVFGDDLKGVDKKSIAELLATPEAFRGKKLRVEGIVRSVCQVRGCWMEVRPAEDRDAEGVTVRFKGYAFFMPKDSRGAKVAAEGTVHVVDMTPEQVEELEAEGGSVGKKNPDGSATSLIFMAYGVEMRGRES